MPNMPLMSIKPTPRSPYSAGNLVAATDQDVIAPPGDMHDIVRDQPMPTLDEIEHAFALADPERPRNSAHAEPRRPASVDVVRGANGHRETLEPT